MKEWLENADLVIFDLDGTLYENTDHFEYLAKQIKSRLRRTSNRCLPINIEK
ncbi:MAG TPA: hypothetical protein VF149_06340 [Bacillales bacterium]